MHHARQDGGQTTSRAAHTNLEQIQNLVVLIHTLRRNHTEFGQMRHEKQEEAGSAKSGSGSAQGRLTDLENAVELARVAEQNKQALVLEALLVLGVCVACTEMRVG